jgi:phosphoribosylanthranilate isomerase
MKIKVCGMRDSANIANLCQLPINYIGFIFFAKSSRFVGEDFDASITNSIPSYIKKVGVFVNASEQYIHSKIKSYNLDAIQLHGSESPEFCKVFADKNIEVIKAFGIDETFDFTNLNLYNDACNYFLFDTKAPSHGGTGLKFDWTILQNYKGIKPFFLSGGITIDDVDMIKNLTSLPIHCLDINSKFEISPAMKDIRQIERFISNFKTE